MAIKACTELHDYERGKTIIKQLSADSFSNQFTQKSLLQFYIQCNDLDSANHIFSTMKNKSNFTYTIMFKGFNSNKMAEKVLNLLDSMTVQPDEFTLVAIISDARNCRESVVSERVSNRMNTLFPDQNNALVSGSILLANIYSSLGDDEQAIIIQSNRRINYGNKAKPGLNWAEKDGGIVEFGAHDHSHPLSSEIHVESKQISYELHEHDFRSEPSWITHPLAENETVESVLCDHSEKLAIAFHFIRGRRPSFIQATKLMAKIQRCEIVLRDANRIHHFNRNGTCSCQDRF